MYQLCTIWRGTIIAFALYFHCFSPVTAVLCLTNEQVMWPVQSVAQAPDVIWWSISGNVKWQTTASLWFTSLTHWAHFNCVSYHYLRLTLPAELHIVLCVRRICLVISTKLARVAFCDVCRNVAAIYCDMFGRNLRPWSLLFAEFLLVLFIYSRFSLPDLISLFLLAHFRVSTTPGNPGNLLEICSVKSVDTLCLSQPAWTM